MVAMARHSYKNESRVILQNFFWKANVGGQTPGGPWVERWFYRDK